MKTLEEAKKIVEDNMEDRLYFQKNPTHIGAYHKFSSVELVDDDGNEVLHVGMLERLNGAVISSVMGLFKHLVGDDSSYDFENLGVPIAKEIKNDIIRKRIVVKDGERDIAICVCYVEIEIAYQAMYKQTRHYTITEILKEI